MRTPFYLDQMDLWIPKGQEDAVWGKALIGRDSGTGPTEGRGRLW